MIEKRTFPRLPRDWEINLQIADSPETQPVLIKGGMSDVSMGGFSFKSEWAGQAGTLIPFAINPKDDFRPMVGVARIAWARGQAGSCECGATFVWVDWTGIDPQAAIGEYILDQMTKKPA